MNPAAFRLEGIGKVFDDRDLDGQQDADEPGLSGVRLLTPRGLQATPEQHRAAQRQDQDETLSEKVSHAAALAVVRDEVRGHETGDDHEEHQGRQRQPPFLCVI